MSEKNRMFHIGDVLSVTTGKLVSPRHMDGIYDILNYMTGENLFTHQLSRACDVCGQALKVQHPQLADVTGDEVTTKNHQAWLQRQVKRFGKQLSVRPLSDGAYKPMNPIVDAALMMSAAPPAHRRALADLVEKLTARIKKHADYCQEMRAVCACEDQRLFRESLAALASLPAVTSEAVELHAILEALEAALDGRPVSEFMESFPIVRRVLDLVAALAAASPEPGPFPLSDPTRTWDEAITCEAGPKGEESHIDREPLLGLP